VARTARARELRALYRKLRARAITLTSTPPSAVDRFQGDNELTMCSRSEAPAPLDMPLGRK